jgi:hypothetical protein
MITWILIGCMGLVAVNRSARRDPTAVAAALLQLLEDIHLTPADDQPQRR